MLGLAIQGTLIEQLRAQSHTSWLSQPVDLMLAPPGAKQTEQRAAVVCQHCKCTSSRDKNSASIILQTAIALMADGAPPRAVEWYSVEGAWSYHQTDPWAGCRSAPLSGDFSMLKQLARAEPPSREATRRLAAAADLKGVAQQHLALLSAAQDGMLRTIPCLTTTLMLFLQCRRSCTSRHS